MGRRKKVVKEEFLAVEVSALAESFAPELTSEFGVSEAPPVEPVATPVPGEDLPPAVGGNGVKFKPKGRAKPPTRYAKFGGK